MVKGREELVITDIRLSVLSLSTLTQARPHAEPKVSPLIAAVPWYTVLFTFIEKMRSLT